MKIYIYIIPMKRLESELFSMENYKFICIVLSQKQT